jgi:uncharacterized protein YigE (DUF2233 family)
MDGLQIREIVHAERTFRVISLDPAKVALDLYGHTPDGSDVHRFSDLDVWLHANSRRLVVATNAGIFMENLRPLGLHIERGLLVRELNTNEGYGNFYLMPNGVFWIDDEGAHIAPTASWSGGVGVVRLATQSGPLVLVGGKLHPKLMPDSPSVLLRSGVCVDGSGRVHLALSKATRFWELATLFRDVLGCADGLYLDGTISQMSDPAHPPRPETDGAFGGILAVTVPEPNAGSTTAREHGQAEP